MAAPRFLALVAGHIKQVIAVATSAGAGDAEKIPSLNTSGVLDDSILNAATTGANKTLKLLGDGTIDPSVMPAGLGADTAAIVASEALAAGDLVNMWNDAGTTKVRKADATAEGKEAHGFVTASFASAATATVYFEGKLTGLTGLTPGARQYLSAATPGGRTETPPPAAGNVVQLIGFAYSTTALTFEAQDTVTVA